MYRSYIKKGVSGYYKALAELAFICSVCEVIALLMLSFAPSREDFKMHKNSFAIFLIVSAIYMLLSFWLFTFKWSQPRSESEQKGQNLKKRMVQANCGCVLIAMYLYYRLVHSI